MLYLKSSGQLVEPPTYFVAYCIIWIVSPGGLLSKRGSRQHTCPLEIHCKGGLTFEGGLLSGGGLLSRLYSILVIDYIHH